MNAGFNRFSLGIQDFDNEVLKTVNRQPSAIPVEELVQHIKQLSPGISVNLDFIYGLPGQTVENFTETIKKAAAVRPDRLVTFSYAHVPWMKKHQKLLEKHSFPDTGLRFSMMESVKQAMKKAKYHSIGIDHFAREDDSLYLSYKNNKLRRNFQGYTDDSAKTVLGFGLSSISAFEGAYVQNLTDAPEYRKAIESGNFPIKKGRILNEDDKVRRNLIAQIMCGYKVDIEQYSIEQQGLVGLQQDGLIAMDGTTLQIMEEGWPFARIAASQFDTYHKQQENQHARAI